MKFFDPFGEITRSANRLPHWQQEGATYFVTFRLADSLPVKRLETWREERRAWMKLHPPPWNEGTEKEYQRRFLSRIDRGLDAGHGSCVLAKPECNRVVDRTLRRFDGDRYCLIASVVMPNHVHVLLVTATGRYLEKVLSSWKTF